jgi:predicted TIM-barrel fold metal-dependent hydrolase
MSGRPIIDGDVHQTLANAAEELVPYLSSGWREFVTSPGFQARPPVMSAGHVWSVNPFGYTRKDVTRDDGALPASSPSYVLSDLIEPFDVQAAVLTGEPALYLSSVANPHFSSELARAYNEHLIDHWLTVDPRFKGSICVELQVPEWAANEVRRHADDPRFVQMAVAPNPLPYGFGHPIYDPVHKACAETGQPFGIHSLGEGAVGSPNGHLASARPSFYIEYQSGGAQGLMTHVMSFIFHGVFERHPDLKVVLIEPGVTWIPAFLRRLDINYKGIRREVPWCRRSPSEYFRDHFRVTTQPFDIEGPNDDLLTSLAAIGAEDFLIFSSDYPHWDGDEPRATLARVPQHWRDKVAFENAAELYNLTVAAPAA